MSSPELTTENRILEQVAGGDFSGFLALLRPRLALAAKILCREAPSLLELYADALHRPDVAHGLAVLFQAAVLDELLARGQSAPGAVRPLPTLPGRPIPLYTCRGCGRPMPGVAGFMSRVRCGNCGHVQEVE